MFRLSSPGIQSCERVNCWTEQVADSPIIQSEHPSSPGTGMSVPIAAPATEQDRNDPVTFHRIMQSLIGDGLKARYEPPKKLSHELFVLMLQLKEREQRKKKTKPQKARLQKPKPPRVASASP
jgi:hypothetical protein